MNKQILSDFFSLPWAMEHNALGFFRERIEQLPEAASFFGIEIPKRQSRLTIDGNVATIPIEGVLLKTVPAWLAFWGISATGYDEIAEMLSAAMSNRKVTEIHLAVSSGGGQVAGLMPVAEAIARARTEKTVTAHIEDIAASAAYWLVSQAETITAADANTTAGSIGVYTVYYDWSGYDERVGIKPVVIRSGDHKGMSEDKITDAQIAAVQEMIDATADNFIDAVAAGRRLDREKIKALADGKLFIARTAQVNGLIDGVAGGQLGTQSENQEMGVEAMETEQETVTAEELVTALNDSPDITAMRDAFPEDPEFALKALGEGWSVEKAKAEYNDVLRSKIADLEKEKQETAKVEHVGGDPLAMRAGSGASVPEDNDFMGQARAAAREQGISVTQAMRELAHAKPELHRAYQEHQAKHGRRQYIGHN